MTEVARIPFDPEIAALLTQLPTDGPALTAETIQLARDMMEPMLLMPAEVIGDRPVEFEERMIPGQPGAPDLPITILRPKGGATNAPGIYNIHGGGLIMGSRHQDTSRLVDLVEEFGIVAVNVDYRLAPENPGTGPAEDCFAGLRWTAEHTAELGIDPARLMVMGGSAGGNLSAAMTLMARDRGGPALFAQVLYVPMLDDRNDSVAAHQCQGLGTWTWEMGEVAWHAVLGEQTGGDDVSPYVAPARATDLTGLPQAYLELASVDPFRDDSMRYAMRLWEAGVPAEVHTWGGGCHGFDMIFPQSQLTQIALEVRRSWFRRVLADHAVT